MNDPIKAGCRLFGSLLIGCLVCAGPLYAVDLPNVERHLVFRDPEGSVLAECIEVSATNDEGGSTSWKVMTPEKHRAVWVADYAADETLFSGSLRDLDTGWTARLAIASDAPSRHPNTADINTFLSDLREQDAMLTVSLETSDGFYAEHHASINASPDEDPDWQPVFGTALAQEEVGLDIPTSASDEIRFIHKIGPKLTREEALAYKLIDLLYQELERARERDQPGNGDSYAALEWELGVGTVEIGSEDDPRATHRELAERFEQDSNDPAPTPQQPPPDGQ